jgi:hypothetical protein
MAAKSLFSDLPALKKCVAQADELRMNIKQYEQGMFQDW